MPRKPTGNPVGRPKRADTVMQLAKHPQAIKNLSQHMKLIERQRKQYYGATHNGDTAQEPLCLFGDKIKGVGPRDMPQIALLKTLAKEYRELSQIKETDPILAVPLAKERLQALNMLSSAINEMERHFNKCHSDQTRMAVEAAKLEMTRLKQQGPMQEDDDAKLAEVLRRHGHDPEANGSHA